MEEGGRQKGETNENVERRKDERKDKIICRKRGGREEGYEENVEIRIEGGRKEYEEIQKEEREED